MVVFRDEETFETAAAMLSREQDQLLDMRGHVVLPY